MAVTSGYVAEEPGADPAGGAACAFEINMKYEVVPCVVCSVSLALGLVYCFLGYRCFKMVMFFSGFSSGTAAMLLLYREEPALHANLRVETKAGMGLGVGVLCGLTTMLAPTTGLLLSGLQLGALLSLAALVVAGQFCGLAPAWAPLAATLAAGIAGAVLTLRWQKLFSIIYTSVCGGTAAALCADHLLGASALAEQVSHLFHGTAPPPLCWFNWATAGICPALGLLGALVQWRFTARGVSHAGGNKKQEKKSAVKRRYRESGGRSHPSRRRRRRHGPPPLKRYAGDVLAPSYLQSLQERQMGTGSSSSSVSTVTHTLIDFDFETGSMVPLASSSSSSSSSSPFFRV